MSKHFCGVEARGGFPNYNHCTFLIRLLMPKKSDKIRSPTEIRERSLSIIIGVLIGRHWYKPGSPGIGTVAR